MCLLETPRLCLRRWKDSDLEPFAQLNADPRVMRYFPATLSREESDRLAQHADSAFETRGWGVCVAELREPRQFVGCIGLSVPAFEAHFTPCVEILWRLAPQHWNRGFATEGARAVLTYAFETLRLNQVAAFTTERNVPSRRVMEKIGMTHNPADDFDHPQLEQGHPLRRHVLYRISAS